MCRMCAEEGKKPDDRIQRQDEDVDALYNEGLNVDDVLMLAFDRLEVNAEDQVARNTFYVLAALFYRTDPVFLYQSVRKEREGAIDNIVKAMKH